METQEEISGQASLVLVAQVFREMGLWAVVRRYVTIEQKVRKHRPLDKVLDAFINILAGGLGIVEVNTRVRPDRAVQVAFGRKSCADQSSVSRTLNVCDDENVAQMKRALSRILRQHGESCRHNYKRASLLLDVDLTGLVAGGQGEGVTKGYFAHQRNRRGRQLGRVVATPYDEIVEEQLYDGKKQLNESLVQLVTAAVHTLRVPENKHKRVILRLDGGAGDDASIEWMLSHGFSFITKVKNWNRARILSLSVKHWHQDTAVADRQIGWITLPHKYSRTTCQVALRFHPQNPARASDWHYQALVLNLSPAQVAQVCRSSSIYSAHSCAFLQSIVHAYDLRDGALEIDNRSDKSGLGLSHRNKRSLPAQKMLMLLCELAHNFIVWTHHQLAAADPRLAHLGIKRTVRDLHHIPGYAFISDDSEVVKVTLQPNHPYADALLHAISG
jgi:hypothetical protein